MSLIKPPPSVILTDDEQDIRTVGELALSAVGGWRVRCASGGQHALELIAAERPDLLILDVMMPVMDGPTTLRRLRESEEGDPLPVVFMTAKVPQEAGFRGLRLQMEQTGAGPFAPHRAVRWFRLGT